MVREVDGLAAVLHQTLVPHVLDHTHDLEELLLPEQVDSQLLTDR